MRRSPDPKTAVIPPIAVTAGQLAEIDRRALAARMTRAAYVRERALGKACAPVKSAPVGDEESGAAATPVGGAPQEIK